MAKKVENKNSIYSKFSNSWRNPASYNSVKLGIPWYPKIAANEGDTIYVLLPQEEGRPDLLSQKFYNTPDLDWVICIANGIKDPLKQLLSGTTIIIPNIESLGLI